MGFRLAATVMVRQGVFPGKPMPGATVPFPLFSPGIGNSSVYSPLGSASLRREAQYLLFTPVSLINTHQSSPTRNKVGKVNPLPYCERSVRGASTL